MRPYRHTVPVVYDGMSPRPGPKRPVLTLRLAQSGIDWIDERAAAEGVQRSELVRRMLAYSVRYMPKGWKP